LKKEELTAMIKDNKKGYGCAVEQLSRQKDVFMQYDPEPPCERKNNL
jgi:hypothetical protein